jgi:peptide/nickel transport system permease protein
MEDTSSQQAQVTQVDTSGGLARARTKRRRQIAKLVREHPLGLFGLILIIVVTVTSLGANQIASYGPLQIGGDPLAAPSSEHWFGTDNLGRDMFARVLHGGRVSLMVGGAAVALGGIVGTILGVVSAYRGGWFDLVVQRVVDSMMAFPTLVLALAIVAALGTSTTNVAIAIAAAIVPLISRIARGAVLSVMQEVYIEAARATGATDMYIMRRHILPNIVAPLLIIITASFGTAIISEAALSFVGLGTPAPHPSWGNMMSGPARSFLANAPWMALFPGIALSMLVFGVNLLGDSLRDLFDPRQRNR